MIRQHFPRTDAETEAEMERAQRIVDETFLARSTTHSPEYRDGCLAILQYFLACRPVRCPYAAGTAERDAFYGGVDVGKRIFCHGSER